MFMYAERKEWPLDAVSIQLSHDKVHARDCADCTQEEVDAAGPQGRIDLIKMDVSVQGDLDTQQVARLLEIGERCPVHRTLEARPKIVSTISHSA
jgi:putative redox protein